MAFVDSKSSQKLVSPEAAAQVVADTGFMLRAGKIGLIPTSSTYERVNRLNREATLPPNRENVAAVAELINLDCDPVKRAGDIANMSADDWIVMSTLLHAALAPESEQTPTTDQMQVKRAYGIFRYHYMKPHERYGHFRQLASLTHELGQQLSTGNESNFLKRTADMAALTVISSHAFTGGNGRTARVLAQLVREGSPQHDSDMQKLLDLGTDRGLMPARTPAFMIPKPGKMPPHEFLSNVAALDLPLQPGTNDAAYEQRCTTLFESPFQEA